MQLISTLVSCCVSLLLGCCKVVSSEYRKPGSDAQKSHSPILLPKFCSKMRYITYFCPRHHDDSTDLHDLHSRTTSEQTPSSSQEKHHHTHHGRDEPQQHIYQIHPYGVLHARDSTIALCVRVDVEIAKDPEHCSPEDTTNH